MGKTRRIKTFTSKSNPLGFVNARELIDFTEGPIEAIRNQLQSCNVEEKINGLQAFAVLTNNSDKASTICQTDIIRIAGPLLCDRDHCIRNAAAGALRNLSVSSTDVCDCLVEQDILTPLLTLLNEYARDKEWKPTFDASMSNQMDLYSDVFLQCTNLLRNLCESSSIAIDVVNQTCVIESLIRCLDYTIYGIDIAISVGQCLLIISENNPKTSLILKENKSVFLDLIKLTGNNSCTYICALVVGILANVPDLFEVYGTIIVQTTSEILAIDQQGAIRDLMHLQSVDAKNGNISESHTSMDLADEESEEAAAIRRRRQELPSDIDIAVTSVGHLIDAQRLAAEIITNLCLNEDDDGDASCDGVDEKLVFPKDEMVMDEMAERASIASIGSNVSNPIIELYPWFLDAIKSSSLVDKLWQRAQPLNSNLKYFLRDNFNNLLIKVKNLWISSILCLQNLCNCLSSDILGTHSAIYNVWVELGQQVFQCNEDVVLVEPCTSLMRSVLEHLKHKPELFHQMTHDDLKLMLDGVQNCSLGEVRANWLRMLGTLGCLLSEPLVKPIISFLVNTCAQDEDVWTISEGLDALMDMFADNDWPQIVHELNLLTILRNIQKHFQLKLRSQRRHLRQRYLAVQTVQENFVRFIKYIKNCT